MRIYDFVNDERSACISMEYVDGETLSNLRAEKERKVFQPNELNGWTSQLCDALDYAHNQARIVHRDLKPANLMVNQKGVLKVSDFGIARSLGDTVSRLTLEQGRSGTLVYMSPQQLLRRRRPIRLRQSEEEVLIAAVNLCVAHEGSSRQARPCSRDR